VKIVFIKQISMLVGTNFKTNIWYHFQIPIILIPISGTEIGTRNFSEIGVIIEFVPKVVVKLVSKLVLKFGSRLVSNRCPN